MKTYYYAHTGHRIGLDRFRRAVAVLSYLNADITLLCSDFRIAQEARNFGVEKAVGIDVVRNIANIAHKGDQLILDSAEVNPIMLEDMKQFFSNLVVMDNDAIVVAEKYFEQKEKNVKISYFFGDDDYEKDLMKNFDFIKELNPHLQLGYYYFLDYEDELQERFENCFEFDEYDDMVMKSEIVISASPQVVLDSLAAGAKPIYIQRADYPEDFNKKFEELNIPIIHNYDQKKLQDVINRINEIKYGKIPSDCNKFVSFIKENIIL